MTTISGHAEARTQAQDLLEELLRLLDAAGFDRSAAYAQMALDSLGDGEVEQN